MKVLSSEHYNRYETSHPIKRFILNRYLRVVCDISNLNPSDSVLFLGCGEGRFIKFLFERKGFDSKKSLGVDIDKSALSIAKKLNPEVEFKYMDLKDLSELSNRQFDYVFILEVLEHISEYEKVLSSIETLQFKKLIISVPREPYFRILTMLALRNIHKLGIAWGHVNFWTMKGFRKVIDGRFKIKRHISCIPHQIMVCEK